MNVKEYWKELRRSASRLDPESARLDAQEMDPSDRKHLDTSQKEIWLVSVDNRNKGSVAGRVVSCTPIIAARMLDDATHLPASPEQVLAYKADLEQRRETQDREEAERKGVPTHKLLEAMIALQQQPARIVGGKPPRE